ncbi:MAG: hypothetical protein WCT37_03610 [Patescibacteria group bacterium]|jgi:hypothetical protein
MTHLEKFINNKRVLRRSGYLLIGATGTLCLITAWIAGWYHNNHPLWSEVITIAILFCLAIWSLLFILYLLAFLWRSAIWRSELQGNSTKLPTIKIKLPWLLGYLAVGVIMVAIVWGFRLNAQKCDDTICFVAIANNCGAAVWQAQDKYGWTWSYYSSGCQLEKKLLSLPNESKQMKAALEDKSLTCSYTKGTFNQVWLNSVMGDLEACQGDLKDTIGKLLLFF